MLYKQKPKRYYVGLLTRSPPKLSELFQLWKRGGQRKVTE